MGVSAETIEAAYREDSLEQIKDAFQTLARLGVWEMLVVANQHQVAQSFSDESDEVLVSKIRDTRHENRVLLTLNSLYPPQ